MQFVAYFLYYLTMISCISIEEVYCRGIGNSPLCSQYKFLTSLKTWFWSKIFESYEKVWTCTQLDLFFYTTTAHQLEIENNGTGLIVLYGITLKKNTTGTLLPEKGNIGNIGELPGNYPGIQN